MEWIHSGPTPNINSVFLERVQGFLNSRSVLHSVEWRGKSGVTPASSSSQFSMGVTSTATEGPKLAAKSLKLQAAAPPSSRTAADSFSADCANARPEQRNKHTNKSSFLVFTRYAPWRRISKIARNLYDARGGSVPVKARTYLLTGNETSKTSSSKAKARLFLGLNVGAEAPTPVRPICETA